MPYSSITHLPSVGSDHCPLLMEVRDINANIIRYFKFLNYWADSDTFLASVEKCWKRKVVGNPMWIFHAKLKRLTKTLREWSKQEYGDIFEKVKQYEDEVKKAEQDMIMNNSIENSEKLNAVNAHYIKYLKLEYKILQQKTQFHWLKEGDANSKYFHAVIRGKRKRMFINKLMDDSGAWIHGEENIAKEACDYYKGIFSANNDKIQEEILQCINHRTTQQQNDELDKILTEDEVKRIIMSMNPNSSPGLDGFGGKFYQECFEIIKDDLMSVIKSFYTDNQSGFVKGRSISENIILAQEIIHGMKLPKEGSNVVIKLDMVKAYDRVSWAYICIVLRKMGFSEVFIDRIWRIMSNSWYSVVINGKRHGFFQSKKGLMQGDPLSPALFILGAEVLSRQLNLLYQNQMYRGFHMERNGPQINHLIFADDIIIFTSTENNSLHLIMKTIEEYEGVSGQQVNKEKSFFMVTSNTNHVIIDNIERATVHTLAAISPPKTTLKCIKKVIADFFWGTDKERNKYHWSSWENLAYPFNEGGIGVSFWWDNWLENDSLASHCDHIFSLNNSRLADFWIDGKWNESLIRQHVPPLFIPNILQTVFKYNEGKEDTAIWLPDETGKFTVSSAWEVIRKKRSHDPINNIIWHKHIPFKISFFIWRAVKGKLPTNETLQSLGRDIVDCYCCYNKGKDDINHILLTSNFANYIWKKHASSVGAVHVNTNMRSQLLYWRNLQTNNEVGKGCTIIMMLQMGEFGLYGMIAEQKKSLWTDLNKMAQNVISPWLIIGDFNAVLSPQDRQAGATVNESEIRDFADCVKTMGIHELQWKGSYYTWSNKQIGNARVLSRINRAFGNDEWMDKWGHVILEYGNPGVSDHSTMQLVLHQSNQHVRASFKFFNIWVEHESFLGLVEKVWKKEKDRDAMEKVWNKLKALQPVLKQLNRKEFKYISNQIEEARNELGDIQYQLYHQARDELVVKEKELLLKLEKWSLIEESALRQKARAKVD
ncbi:uncharacterized protein [Solanum lycopersicum]|uniref:uncharacterized protein n=1 Tax=Solanum lycopersicum TaxID=4081 RepID=UPI00374866CE